MRGFNDREMTSGHKCSPPVSCAEGEGLVLMVAVSWVEWCLIADEVDVDQCSLVESRDVITSGSATVCVVVMGCLLMFCLTIPSWY